MQIRTEYQTIPQHIHWLIGIGGNFTISCQQIYVKVKRFELKQSSAPAVKHQNQSTKLGTKVPATIHSEPAINPR